MFADQPFDIILLYPLYKKKTILIKGGIKGGFPDFFKIQKTGAC